MQTPVQVDFHGIDVSPAAQATIDAQIRALEEKFGRITACRVVVAGPGHHHRTGLYDVRIHLSLPDGKQVDVDQPSGDERQADIRYAIKDAFKRARRQMHDQVKLLRGETKRHETQSGH